MRQHDDPPLTPDVPPPGLSGGNDGALVGPETRQWEVRLERIRIYLGVGVHVDEAQRQPVEIDLALRGRASAAPHTLSDCIDYEPLLHWIEREWPRTPHTPLLETRLAQLVEACFRLDRRVDSVAAGLFKTRLAKSPGRVGMTIRLSRAEFDQSDAAPTRTDGAWSFDSGGVVKPRPPSFGSHAVSPDPTLVRGLREPACRQSTEATSVQCASRVL